MLRTYYYALPRAPASPGRQTLAKHRDQVGLRDMPEQATGVVEHRQALPQVRGKGFQHLPDRRRGPYPRIADAQDGFGPGPRRRAGTASRRPQGSPAAIRTRPPLRPKISRSTRKIPSRNPIVASPPSTPISAARPSVRSHGDGRSRARIARQRPLARFIGAAARPAARPARSSRGCPAPASRARCPGSPRPP